MGGVSGGRACALLDSNGTVTLRHSELDWPGVLALAGRLCATERGLEAMLASAPTPERAEAERRLRLTADLVARRGLLPPVALGGIDEAAPLLARLGPGARALDPEDLLDLFVLVERAEGAREAVPVPGVPLSELTAFLGPLEDLSDLLCERSVVFEPDGRVKDTASARLAAIRAAIVRLRQDVVRRLEELVRVRPDFLADGYVTEKRGRYCLPVRTDRREGVAGIVHEKSGSGQTLFVEPLAVVESNNALAEAVEEEREEVQRILRALTARFVARKPALTLALRILIELDAYQARAELARKTDAIFPEFGDVLRLVSARHPLLDRRLAALREEVFGENASERHVDAVPLDVALRGETKTLLLSGPNAGGKSVAMKTVGLFSLLSQSGFALPAAPGTSLPAFDEVLVVAGDAQDLLGDLSSFAAAMTRTARVLVEASPRSLVLLDELGSGTDPDEGGAIAIAVLEEDRHRGGFTVATTHLSAVKEWAQDQPGVLSAAMEFDEKAGRPTFHLRLGASGRSRALAVAEKAGLPARTLAAARARLGEGWAARDRALARLEEATRGAEAEVRKASEAARKAEERLDDLEREKAALSAERSRLKEKAKAEVERALEALRERTRRELDRLREEARAGRAIGKGALTTITHAAREEALSVLPGDEPAPTEPVALGDLVRVQPFRTLGKLVALDESRGEAEVDVGGKRMRVARAALVRAAGGGTAPAAPRRAAVPSASASVSASPAAVHEIVLVGLRVDAALPEVERAINEALLQGKGTLRVVHGHGTGRLAAAVKEFLSEHPGVASHRPGDASEGGTAVTIARLDT